MQIRPTLSKIFKQVARLATYLSEQLDVAPGKPDTLFHGAFHAASGKHLHTSWCTTHTKLREGYFLFAADSMTLSLAHSLKVPRHTVNAGYMDKSIYLMVADLDAFLKAHQQRQESGEHGIIYEIPSKNFTLVKDRQAPFHEWISKKKIPIAKCKTYQTQTIDDAMTKGVQIFYINTTELEANERFLSKGRFEPHDIAPLISEGTVGWLNNDKGLSPDTELIRALNAVNPTAQLNGSSDDMLMKLERLS